MLSSNTSSEKCEVFLDLTHLDRSIMHLRKVCLVLLFHPDYPQNGLFYLYYTLQNPKRSVLVERKLLNFKKLKVDDTYSREVISIPQPYWNHNSGYPVLDLMVIFIYPLVMEGKRMIPTITPRIPFPCLVKS